MPSASATAGPGDAGDRVLRARTVELKAGAYGHFHANAEINGQPVSVMVDTGASIVALTFEDARAAGLYVRDSDFTQRVSTANGFARVAPSRSTASASATSPCATCPAP